MLQRLNPTGAGIEGRMGIRRFGDCIDVFPILTDQPVTTVPKTCE
jgi:hypothetical protein